MSQGRSRKSPWRDVLAEVNAQQTLLETLLHPDRELDATHLSAHLTIASTPQMRSTAQVSAARGGNSSLRPLSQPHPLLSPSLDGADAEVRPLASHSSHLTNSNGDVRRVSVASRRSTNAEDNSNNNASRVVDALVEALSTSSWSSNEEAASRSRDELSPTATQPNLPASVRDARTLESVLTEHEDHVAGVVDAQTRALQAAPFFLRATRVAADEFEERQHIMFNEFTAVTELISRFVCHMSKSSVNK